MSAIHPRRHRRRAAARLRSHMRLIMVTAAWIGCTGLTTVIALSAVNLVSGRVTNAEARPMSAAAVDQALGRLHGGAGAPAPPFVDLPAFGPGNPGPPGVPGTVSTAPGGSPASSPSPQETASVTAAPPKDPSRPAQDGETSPPSSPASSSRSPVSRPPTAGASSAPVRPGAATPTETATSRPAPSSKPQPPPSPPPSSQPRPQWPPEPSGPFHASAYYVAGGHVTVTCDQRGDLSMHAFPDYNSGYGHHTSRVNGAKERVVWFTRASDGKMTGYVAAACSTKPGPDGRYQIDAYEWSSRSGVRPFNPSRPASPSPSASV